LVYKKLNKIELFIILLTALLISLVYASLNFNYLSNWIDEKGDVLTYDYYVRLGVPQFLFNPHHIGFDWAGEQLYKTLLKNGYTGKSMIVLQIRNLLASSIGLGVIFFLFYSISKKYFLSLLVVISYCFTAAYWMYSQINDTPIIHSILVFVLFLSALYFPQAKRKMLFALFLGTLHAITIFFHQSDLIMMPVILFIMLFHNLFSNDREQKLFQLHLIIYIIAYLTIFSIIVITAYYYVGIILVGLTFDYEKATDFNMIKKASYFFNWLILYSKIDYWGKGFEDMSLFQKIVHGISTYFYQPQSFKGTPLGHNFQNLFAPYAILPNLIGIIFVTVLGGSIVFFKHIFQKYRYAFIGCILYMVIYTAFTCWWEADYREFWVAPMFSFWFLMLLFFSAILDSNKNFLPLIKTFSYTTLFLLASLLFYFNFTGFIKPNIGRTYTTYEIIRKK